MSERTEKLILGIEGGGTQTHALYARCRGHQINGAVILSRKIVGPGNIRLLKDAELEALFREIAEGQPKPDAIGMGIAGARTEADRKRVRTAAEAVWGCVPMIVTHDLEIALACSEFAGARVLVLSGTGACCYGKTASGREAKVGGWGHILGDRGSGYAIAAAGLRAAIADFDRGGKTGRLLQKLLRSLLLNEPEELIGWVQQADKRELASVAPAVFEAAAEGDAAAQRVLDEAAESLFTDAKSCAMRLRSENEAKGKQRLPVQFVFAGSVLLKQRDFAVRIGRSLMNTVPNASVQFLEREAVWGAVALAARVEGGSNLKTDSAISTVYVPSFVPELSPTEQRNPASVRLDKISARQIVRLMIEQERAVPAALAAVASNIARVAEAAGDSLKNNGRILYVGAGTSGRLGVLDASECPPTFRASPDMVQGIIAGGQKALWQAVEGAEDDAEAGGRAVRSRNVSNNDLVIGIAASGRTPFVWGALAEAKASGARTALVCFNPAIKIERGQKPDFVIAANVGPEILTGSTRLKSGTATKLILNMISTIAMVRIGKVASNLMIDLNPSNVKLRDRAVRMIQQLGASNAEMARVLLEKNDWVVRKAWQELSKKSQAPRATKHSPSERKGRKRRNV